MNVQVQFSLLDYICDYVLYFPGHQIGCYYIWCCITFIFINNFAQIFFVIVYFFHIWTLYQYKVFMCINDWHWKLLFSNLIQQYYLKLIGFEMWHEFVSVLWCCIVSVYPKYRSGFLLVWWRKRWHFTNLFHLRLDIND